MTRTDGERTQKRETPLAGRRAGDAISGGVVRIVHTLGIAFNIHLPHRAKDTSLTCLCEWHESRSKNTPMMLLEFVRAIP